MNKPPFPAANQTAGQSTNQPTAQGAAPTSASAAPSATASVTALPRRAGAGPAAGRAMPPALQQVIGRRDTWLGRDILRSHGAPDLRAANGEESPSSRPSLRQSAQLPTGFAPLDGQLAGGGWPLDSTIEVLSDAGGMGAMGLFLPAMQALVPQHRWQAFIAPPHTPYAPLLAARGIDIRQVLLVHPKNREEILWSAEQALRSTTCSAVFCWLGAFDYSYGELRRLQLAAASSRALAVLFRPRQAACEHAPAGLRLEMRAYREVHVLKQRGGPQGVDVYLPPEDDVPHQPQLWELPADSAAGASRAAV